MENSEIYKLGICTSYMGIEFWDDENLDFEEDLIATQMHRLRVQLDLIKAERARRGGLV